MRKEGKMTARTRQHNVDSLEIGKRLDELFHAGGESGPPDTKSKELLMLTLACVRCCPHCTQEQMQRALDVGATEDEVAEALLVAFYWIERFCEKPLGADAERVSERSTDAATHDKGHTEGAERSGTQIRECLSQAVGCIA